jgi:ankyrin repeat protein
MNGDSLAVAALLQQKADVNAPQADGATAIQWAAYRNNLPLADVLIKAGANVKLANRDGATPLSLAAENGSAAMIEKLIEAGADPNERRPTGETPLMMAARNGNAAALKVLLDHQADVNAKENLRGTTALMWAAEQSHPDAVKVLLDHGADKSAATSPDTRNSRLNIAPSVQQRLNSAQGAGGLGAFGNRARANRGPRPGAGAAGGISADDFDLEAFFRGPQVKDGGGLTPLSYAAREGCFDCVKTLVEAGADVNQLTLYGWSPLLVATQNRHYKIGAYLLDHGANPNLPNKGGWTPLYLATDNRNIESGDYPVRKPDVDHLEYIKLLIEKGAHVNARICGVQSTDKDCKGDTTETRTNFTMQWLYEDGATPFLRAAQSGDTVLISFCSPKAPIPRSPLRTTIPRWPSPPASAGWKA